MRMRPCEQRKLRHAVIIYFVEYSTSKALTNSLIGKEPIRNITMTKLGGSQQRLITDPHPVVNLIARFQSTQDRHGILRTGLINHNLLEATLQRLILLDVLAILVESGGTNAAELASGQGRFEEIGRIHGSRGGTGTDDGVHLINKQDDLTLGLGNLLEYGFETLFEFTSHGGAGDECTEIETDEFAWGFHAIGNVTVNHSLRYAFGDGRLPNSRITNKHRIILSPPR
mmetsp:Transcript_38335/g.78167  ORF Transcript_38335/g.78167 Transcript_38335/m.78167 type:complete len:228 (-) Transcript_38335:856-1539(-)